MLRQGYKVGSIDIDARQGTLTRYLGNRETNSKDKNLNLPLPQHIPVYRSLLNDQEQNKDIDNKKLMDSFKILSYCDFIIVDTPGNDTFLSRTANSFADTVVTPINDSLIDLDVLVHIDQKNNGRARPSIYAETLWEQKKSRIIRDKKEIDWIVVRNRLSNIQSNNKSHMKILLNELEKKIGFRQATGFSERVIFRELFLSGTTLFDMDESKLSLSHVAARQEMRSLMHNLNIEKKR